MINDKCRVDIRIFLKYNYDNMAKTITIPKELVRKGELVLIPRVEYEGLLRVSKYQKELDESIAKSLKEIQKGKIAGPFGNSKNLIKSLS